MSLNVYTGDCNKEAEIRTNTNMQFSLGMIMMVLGMSEITGDQDINNFQSRLTFYDRLCGSPEPITKYVEMAKSSVGIKINGVPEKTAAWVKRISAAKFKEIQLDIELKALGKALSEI